MKMFQNFLTFPQSVSWTYWNAYWTKKNFTPLYRGGPQKKIKIFGFFTKIKNPQFGPLNLLKSIEVIKQTPIKIPKYG